ncbi:hypothetical protein [Bacillus sp. V5-8f]|uniref:hypothetical protein n=1 Tax=Bacillus sp. V5-8f TaxID=2053044 RepID=UPI001C609AB2|nr:hypothetical protein [Bacillus sp. V5-8f]
MPARRQFRRVVAFSRKLMRDYLAIPASCSELQPENRTGNGFMKLKLIPHKSLLRVPHDNRVEKEE